MRDELEVLRQEQAERQCYRNARTEVGRTIRNRYVMNDRRTELRLDEEDSIFVQVLSAPTVRALEGRTFFCASDDISELGLRFRVEIAIPVESQLLICIAFTNPRLAFRFHARVAWISAEGDSGRSVVGVKLERLVESASMMAWKALVRSGVIRAMMPRTGPDPLRS